MFSHSGYFASKNDPENSPITYVSRIDPSTRKKLWIYLDAGSDDGEYLTQSREFHQKLDQLGVINVFNQFPGGHGIVGADVGWNYWHRHLADSLKFVGDRFRDADMVERAHNLAPSAARSSHIEHAQSLTLPATQSSQVKSSTQHSSDPTTQSSQVKSSTQHSSDCIISKLWHSLNPGK
jgi:hypothetical protein